MPLRDDLLTPIAGENPAGADLRYDPVYDKIKDARREDDILPQGDWETERKVADHQLVIKLAGDLLATKTKDLQVAVWLTEALLKREGYGGLRDGLTVVRELLVQFWDTLYPELEDGDAELRAGPLEWLATKLDIPLRMVPLNRAGHTYLQYLESRNVPTETVAENDRDKRSQRETAIEEGKLPPEAFDRSFEETPKAFYKQLAADIAGAIAAVDALSATADERLGSDAPSYRGLRGTLEEVQRAAKTLLQQKLELDPDPPELEVAPEGEGDGTAAAGEGAAAGGALTAEPVSAEDAAGRVVGAARWLRRASPGNPAPYLMLRGLRWGELRAPASGDAHPEPRLLVAPPTQVRQQLKGYLLDAKWRELLEAAEGVMGTPAGRGWLDLQRYVLTACEGLGGEYAPVAAAVRGSLAALLRDLPQLVEMTLMDDTPTANAETRAWLEEHVLADDAAGEAGDAEASEPAEGEEAADASERVLEEALAEERPNGAGTNGHAPRGRAMAWSVNDRAMAEVRAGRPERGIELLMREVARERSPRARFIRRTQVARIMVEAGRDEVALPILRELVEQIEEHKLEAWESGDLVAQPMALLWRCLTRLERDEDQKEELYLRICRLDPVQALSFGS